MASREAGVAEAIAASIAADDRAAIRACVLDYFEGWFDGDAERMDRALHAALAKHGPGQDATGTDSFAVTTKDQMVAATRRGVGRLRDVPDRAIRIDVAAVSGNIASVIVRSAVYIEYVLLAKTSAGWQITSTVWHRAISDGQHA